MQSPFRITLTSFAIALALSAGACGSDDDASPAASTTSVPTDVSPGGAEDDEQVRYPDVVDVELTALGGGDYDVAVTLSSPYDSAERYADAWRVLDEDGDELGVRELLHDHAGEQPFTRSETIAIPDDVDEVTVEGRDQISGYGGETVTVSVPRDDA